MTLHTTWDTESIHFTLSMWTDCVPVALYSFSSYSCTQSWDTLKRQRHKLRRKLTMRYFHVNTLCACGGSVQLQFILLHTLTREIEKTQTQAMTQVDNQRFPCEHTVHLCWLCTASVHIPAQSWDKWKRQRHKLTIRDFHAWFTASVHNPAEDKCCCF